MEESENLHDHINAFNQLVYQLLKVGMDNGPGTHWVKQSAGLK